MNIRELERFDAVIVGGNTAAMICALQAADRGARPLLISAGTYLYEEIFDAGDLRIPKVTFRAWGELLFPGGVTDESSGLLHPDRLKRHGEALMESRGIRLLYACRFLAFRNGRAVLAAKSGLYSVPCGCLYDCRALPLGKPDGYFLHTMERGTHRMRLIPTKFTGDSARERYSRYSEALDVLFPGETLARSGTEPGYLNGIDMDAVIRFGLEQTPAGPSHTDISCPGTSADVLPFTGKDECDILVAGGGTAGASAALFCARQGLKTVLIEMNRRLGGTATVGGVSCYWFGIREGAARIISEAVAACRDRHHQPAMPGLWCSDDAFSPDLKAHVLLGLCLDAGVDVRFGCTAFGAECADRRVTGIFYARDRRPWLTRASMTIDCTGDGDAAVFSGAGSVYGGEEDGMTYWASLAQYPCQDKYRNNFSNMVRTDNPWDYTRFIIAARKLGENMYDHGSYVAVRESRHVRALETVTLESLLLMLPVRDPLYTCFSNYDPKGRLTAEMCYWGLLPPNLLCAIPRGAVIPADNNGRMIRGLLVGGKAIGCTHDAFPGIRMQADLERQGLALAALAGCAVRQGTDALAAAGVTERILSLGGDADFPEPSSPASPDAVIAALTGDEAWEWLDTPVTVYETSVPPVIRIMLSKSETVLPLLRDRYKKAGDPRLRILLARLLLWHGDASGAGDVVSAVRDLLEKCPDGLPRREGSVNYGQMLPDHGLMPEAVYLINALSNAPDTDIADLMEEVLRRLENTRRDWHDLRAGIYCWCESFGRLAKRRHDLSLAPMIRRVLKLPEVENEPGDPLLAERVAMLSLGLYGALRSLGCPDGEHGLRRFLQDRRAAISAAASQLLH